MSLLISKRFLQSLKPYFFTLWILYNLSIGFNLFKKGFFLEEDVLHKKSGEDKVQKDEQRILWFLVFGTVFCL